MIMRVHDLGCGSRISYILSGSEKWLWSGRVMMVKGGGELGGFPAVDGQLGVHSCLGLFVDTGCLPRTEMGEGSSFCSP